MSDEDKDYDELPSDLDDPDATGFSIGDRLDVPEAKMYTTQELHTLIHEGVIDLNPPYQRDVVWPQAKQIKLLDSIYRNFYVPPIVFAIYQDETGEWVKKCVDGKQRLTSVQMFFDGQIPYRDPRTKKAFYWTCSERHKSTRLEVPGFWKRDFASKQITCVEYSNLSEGMERDVFQRVQLGMPLTAAEKLQAIASPWQEWILNLDARFVSSNDGITNKIDVDMKRGRDFQSLAQLIYCCYGIPEQLIPTATKMESWLAREDGPSPPFKKAISDVLTEYWHLAHTDGLNAAFTQIPQRVAPIEFVFIGVLLFVMSRCSHEDRATEIYQMRIQVRKAYPDVRARSDIVKFLWGFVASIAEEYDTGVYFSDGPSAPARKVKKRKARQEESEGEDEDEYRSNAKPSGSKTRGKRKSGR